MENDNMNYRWTAEAPDGDWAESQDNWARAREVMAAAAAEPPLTPACGPFLLGSVGFVVAEPGVGKSFFALGLAGAIANGDPLGSWETPGISEVRIVDAELTHHELADRLEILNLQDTPSLWFDTSAARWRDNQDQFSLGSLWHQDYIYRTCEKARVIIIDNVTFTLDPAEGHSLYSPETINQMKPLLNWARLQNKCLILVDHTNREGAIHGHSNKQRLAQWVLKLEKGGGNGPVSVEGTWTKYRCGPMPTDFTLDYEGGQFRMAKKLSIGEEIREAIADGVPRKEIIDEYGKNAYYRYRR